MATVPDPMNPTEPIAFGGATVDRSAALRADALNLATHPQARAVLIGREGASPTPVSVATIGGVDLDRSVLLGADGEGPLFAVEAHEGAELMGLRDAAASLPSDHAGLMAYAAALLHWTRNTRYCGRCGEPTEPREGGHMRICKNEHQHHPRTDPVVIMLVEDGDRALLGRQQIWPPGRFSTLAGFVEPGESLESAVAREVREEAAVDVHSVRYVASQPWPFPGSLMLGFEATYAGGDLAIGDKELEEVRWVSRDEMAAAAASDHAWEDEQQTGALLLPPRTAIARVLIEHWLAG
jgi:NAD+ diphosphatase